MKLLKKLYHEEFISDCCHFFSGTDVNITIETINAILLNRILKTEMQCNGTASFLSWGSLAKTMYQLCLNKRYFLSLLLLYSNSELVKHLSCFNSSHTFSGAMNKKHKLVLLSYGHSGIHVFKLILCFFL